MTTRLTADHRRAMILAAAKAVSANGGLYDWALSDVADHVGISTAGVNYYFGSAQGLRRETIVNAVADRDVDIVVQAIAHHDPIVADIPSDLRDACARFIQTGELGDA